MRRRWLVPARATVALLLGLAGGPLRAEAREPPAAEPEYDVPVSCPPPATWQQALKSRLDAAASEQAVRLFRVHVRKEPAGGGYTGQLAALDTQLSEARRVNGASCAEVLEALALIASLELRRPAAAPASEAPELGAAAGPEPARDAPPAAEPARAGQHWGVAGLLSLQGALSPRWGLDSGVGVTFAWHTQRWQPKLLLGVLWGSDSLALEGGRASARFERSYGLLGACPLRFPAHTSAGVRPCAALELGQLSGSGSVAGLASRSSALVANAGLELQLEWAVMEHLELGASLGGVLTLARPRFYFAPEFTALEVAPWGVRSSAAATLTF